MNDFVAFHTSYRVATVGGMVSLKIYSLIEKPRISTYFKTPKCKPVVAAHLSSFNSLYILKSSNTEGL